MTEIPEPSGISEMPEVAEIPEVVESPEVAESSEVAETPPVPSVPAARRGRRVVAIAGVAALGLACLGGVGYTAVTVHGADRAAGKPSWRLPKEAAATKTPQAKGLKGMLLPYDTYAGGDYSRGPDMGEFGSDTEFSGAEATAMRRESLKTTGLSASQRRRLERQLAKSPVKGIAMRSYVGTYGSDDDWYGGESVSIEIVLTRMADQRAVRSGSAAQKRFVDALKVFREGPKIKGHKGAYCFLPAAVTKEKLDGMVCSGYVGDVMVTAMATAAKPLDKVSVAGLFKDQLDRIDNPGQAV